MKQTWKKRLGAMILTVAMLSSNSAIFAETLVDSVKGTSANAIDDKVLFSTSFEDDENANLLESTLDGNKLSNVVNTEYLSQGGGLAIRYETVNGSTDYLGSECKYNLFDDKTSTKFLASGSKIYVVFALEKEAIVRSYDVASANDEPGRDPSAWTLYGSDDGEDWNALDSRSGITFSKRQETKKFGFDNTASYKWYKFEVTSNKGASLTQLSTLHLFSEAADEGDGKDVAGAIKILPESIKGMAELGYNASQNKAAMFDGSTETKFISADPTGFVSVQFSAPIVITGYRLGTADDNTTHPQRSPKSWVLYGSTDGSNWIELDSQTNVSLTGNSKLHTFEIANEAAYDYYKLDITANGGMDGTNRNIIAISEWQFVTAGGEDDSEKEEEDTSSTLQEVDTTTVKGTAPNDGDGNLNLFDGDVNTKLCLVNATSLWVSVKLKTPTAINMYKIGSANDHDPRDPKDWVIYGSKDGTTWVELDRRTEQSFQDRNTLYTFYFKNDVEYSYYKLDILSHHGEDLVGLNVVQLSEWQLFVTTKEIEDPADNKPVPTVDKSTVKSDATSTGSEGILSIFDGNENTKVCNKGKTLWVSFALVEPMVIKGYTITSANDHETRNPKAWTFYGSNDGTTWVKLDTRNSINFSGYFEKQAFAFVNSTEYKYYKLDITANCGNEYTQFADLTLLTETDGMEEQRLPGMVTKPAFGPISTECNYPGAWSGLSCLAVYGEQTDTKDTYARNVIFKDLSIPVTKNTKLSYVIFPGLFNVNAYDYEYTSCRVIIDLAFTDGTYLSDLGAIDQYGSKMTPSGQVEGECLYTIQWNYVESYIGDVAAGKTIEKICVYFDMPEAHDASRFVTFFDDLVIEDKAPVVYEHLSDYINILRGTNNDIAFSRGMCTPGVVLPGGFNFFTPVTNPQAATLPYTYQQNGENSPLDSISILHAPNFWIGSYGSFQFMPNTSVDTSNGTAGITSAQISSDARESKFTHQNEAPRAHEYTVTLNEGTAASGVTIEVTPTTHGAYARFTFPAGSDNVNVIFDSLWGSGNLKFGTDGKSFSASTNHGSTMYVYGEFDTAYASASVVSGKQGIVSFPEGTTTVTMKLATSFISANQAKKNLSLEIGTADTYDTIFAKAQKEWDDLCGIFEIEGATYNQLVTFYSCLYRLYAFPSLYSENEGTNEDPVWAYRSPHDGSKKSGILYTNNGFWDTYRTAWGAYALFTPTKDAQYLNGMVQHYTETGWVPRWLGPGPVNCMVGTSSDVIFADAYLKGVDFNYEEAWKAMLKSASAYAPNMTAGGRKENNTAPFLGYIANDKIVNGNSEFVGEAYSSSIEGYINDYGLYRMAEAMGLEDEAEYYYNRCMQYVLLYNAAAGFFMGKSTAGVWSSGQAAFNPAQWNGPMYDFTESVGWMYAFPAVFDGQGLATLHGGAENLAKKLNALFDDSYEAMQEVVEIGSVHHEIAEFKEVKMGQYMHSNQPSHHVIYTYAFSSEPYRVQQYTREVLRHVYVGSEIGQGYPGDEDNGEMSGWYVFNALGFYPYSMGSNEYVIGSPLFEKVTIHLENGKDIVIKANNNSFENVYIQSATLNGKAYNNMFLTHEQLTSGCEIVFEMGATPSTWGSGEDSAPISLTAKGEKPTALADLTNTGKISTIINGKTNMITSISGAEKLFDNNSLTYTTISGGDTITLAGSDPSAVSMITLTSHLAKNAPKAFTLEVSNDGDTWFAADQRTNIEWNFDNYVQSFSVPENIRGMYMYYRVTLYGGSQLAEIEFIGEKGKEPLFGFAGYQKGEDGSSIRLVGYTDSLAYDKVDLAITVTGDAKTSFTYPTATVYKTLYGMVNGQKTAVASTKADAGAKVTIDHDYLYGYAITDIPAGNYTFTIVPTATIGNTTVTGESVTLQITVAGGNITVK